jgi:hypothetical protein
MCKGARLRFNTNERDRGFGTYLFFGEQDRPFSVACSTCEGKGLVVMEPGGRMLPCPGGVTTLEWEDILRSAAKGDDAHLAWGEFSGTPSDLEEGTLVGYTRVLDLSDVGRKGGNMVTVLRPCGRVDRINVYGFLRSRRCKNCSLTTDCGEDED